MSWAEKKKSFGYHDDLRQPQILYFKLLVDLKSLINKKYSPREEKVRSVQGTDDEMSLPE